MGQWIFLGFLLGMIALCIIQAICRSVDRSRLRGLAGKTYSIYWETKKGEDSGIPQAVRYTLPKAISGLLTACAMRPSANDSDFKIILIRLTNNPEAGLICYHDWYFRITVEYRGRKLPDYGGYVEKGNLPDLNEILHPLASRIAGGMREIDRQIAKAQASVNDKP